MNKLIMTPLLCSSFLFLLACGSSETNSGTPKQDAAKQVPKTISHKAIVLKRLPNSMNRGLAPACLTSVYWLQSVRDN